MSSINEGGVSEARERLPLEPLNLYSCVKELLLEAPNRFVIDAEFVIPDAWPLTLRKRVVELEPNCVVALPVMIPTENLSAVLVGV